MLSAYSNGGEIPDAYIGNMAQVLCQFPREVAVQACSPVHGVPKQYRHFRPNTGEVYEWCEERTEPIWERAKFERPALPAPTMSAAEMDAGKKRVQEILDRFKAGRNVVNESWFENLSVADAERNLGIRK